MSDRPEPPPRCTATTRAGNPCKNPRTPGQQTCTLHTPQRGSRPQCTDTWIATACEYLSTGCTIKDAALQAGVSERTWFEWVKAGEEEIEQGKSSPFTRFAQASSRARAVARASMVGVIKDAAIGYEYTEHVLDKAGNLHERTAVVGKDWRAAAWFLERSDPDNWRRRESVDPSVTGAAAGVTVTPEDDRRDEVLATLRAALPPDMTAPAP